MNVLIKLVECLYTDEDFFIMQAPLTYAKILSFMVIKEVLVINFSIVNFFRRLHFQ